MEMLQQVMEVLHKVDNETVNVFGVTEQEEMFKGGIDVEHCWVIRLK